MGFGGGARRPKLSLPPRWGGRAGGLCLSCGHGVAETLAPTYRVHNSHLPQHLVEVLSFRDGSWPEYETEKMVFPRATAIIKWASAPADAAIRSCVLNTMTRAHEMRHDRVRRRPPMARRTRRLAGGPRPGRDDPKARHARRGHFPRARMSARAAAPALWHAFCAVAATPSAAVRSPLPARSSWPWRARRRTGVPSP